MLFFLEAKQSLYQQIHPHLKFASTRCHVATILSKYFRLFFSMFKDTVRTPTFRRVSAGPKVITARVTVRSIQLSTFSLSGHGQAVYCRRLVAAVPVDASTLSRRVHTFFDAS